MRLSKKIFIFSSVAFLIVVFFGGIYFFIFAPKENYSDKTSLEKESSVSEKKPSTQIPEEQKIEALSDEAVLSPILTPDGQFIRYYSKSTGQAFELDFFTVKKKILSSTELSGIINVYWSPDTSKVLSEFSGGANGSKFSLYDYSQKKGTSLSENISAVSWQNSGKMLYVYFDAARKIGSLNIANPDGSDWHKITDVSTKDLTIAPIPMSGLISFWNNPDSFSETILQSVSPLNMEKKDLAKGSFGTDYLWSPNGSVLLKSSVDKKGGSKMQIDITNGSGGEYKNLGIPTLASKCAWSKDSKFIYYAQPNSIPEDTVMPNDYMENKFNTSDTFWKINLATGEKSRLINLDEIQTKYDAASLFLNTSESLLFFINRIDGKLYKLTL